jgi:hypothetical protein
MDTTIAAKPIEWAGPEKDCNGLVWSESRYGFYIQFDPTDQEDSQYFSAWGEGPEAHHATLDDAKQWCQMMADDCVRDWAVVTPNA